MAMNRLSTQIRLAVQSEIARHDIRDQAMTGYDDARRLWWMVVIDAAGEIVRERCKRMGRKQYQDRLAAAQEVAELRPGHSAGPLH